MLETSIQNKVPFNKPYMTGKELWNIAQAHQKLHLSGDGFFTRQCNQWLENHVGCRKALLTHSCTAALEMSALLAKINPGDEVIMPSYTFVSTANAFVLRGATPIFVDIRADTLNLDENLLEQAITSKTRAIIPVHYAGVGCEMDTIQQVADAHNLLVIEDAAQGIRATYKGRPLGSIGHLGTYSFHETKNVTAGEGGALLINSPRFCEQAEITWEKGTNRSQFFRGVIDKYTWVDLGSSFLPGEVVGAFLLAQLEEADSITNHRLMLWQRYHDALASLESAEKIRRPIVPPHCQHNAHMYYVLLPTEAERNTLMEQLSTRGISTVFHYIPLHSSPAGQRFGRAGSPLRHTNDLSGRLLRLPLWIGCDVDRVINVLYELL